MGEVSNCNEAQQELSHFVAQAVAEVREMALAKLHEKFPSGKMLSEHANFLRECQKGYQTEIAQVLQSSYPIAVKRAQIVAHIQAYRKSIENRLGLTIEYDQGHYNFPTSKNARQYVRLLVNASRSVMRVLIPSLSATHRRRRRNYPNPANPNGTNVQTQSDQFPSEEN